MRSRLDKVLATSSVAVVLVISATGCARKAVQVPPIAGAQPVATSPGNAPPPTPTETTPVEPSTKSEVAPVFFAFDSYALSETARAILDGNARLLRERRDARVTIEGHCDERGTVEYNQALGERRAHAARDYLVAAGIPATSIQTISFGKERPFEEGHDEAAWSQNRRAHFVPRMGE